MKPTTAALYFATSLILALVVIALAITSPNIIFSGSNTATPTSILTPTPTATNPPTTPPANYTYKYPLTFTYSYKTKDLNNNQTAVTYLIVAAYHKDTPITINYSDFYLKLSVRSGISTFDVGTALSQNNGALSLGPSHTREVFDLTFQFPTTRVNGVEQTALFKLHYSGEAKLFG